MLPWADAQAMQMHLDEISRHVARKAPCGCADGSGRMAHHRQTQSPEEPHHHPAAIARSGTEPGGKYLAVLARQLALQPRVRRLQCHRRCWMRSLEQAHRTARNHHINRNAKMGPYRSMVNAAGMISHFLVATAREFHGKEPGPTAGVIDSQTIKTTESGGISGYDAGKKTKGRKRHISPTRSGLWLGWSCIAPVFKTVMAPGSVEIHPVFPSKLAPYLCGWRLCRTKAARRS